MKNYHEAVHTLRFSCNSVYIACNLGNGTEGSRNRDTVRSFIPTANCQNKGPNNPYTGDYQHGILQGNSYAFGRCLRTGSYILPGP
jgi:hypothetical protein